MPTTSLVDQVRVRPLPISKPGQPLRPYKAFRCCAASGDEAAAPGLRLLQSAWLEEDPAQKPAVLEGLRIWPKHPEDEAFLEDCLQERRKEIRQVAAELLGLHPGSRANRSVPAIFAGLHCGRRSKG